MNLALKTVALGVTVAVAYLSFAQVPDTEAGAPVRGFDLAGMAVGSCSVKLKGKGN